MVRGLTLHHGALPGKLFDEKAAAQAMPFSRKTTVEPRTLVSASVRFRLPGGQKRQQILLYYISVERVPHLIEHNREHNVKVDQPIPKYWRFRCPIYPRLA